MKLVLLTSTNLNFAATSDVAAFYLVRREELQYFAYGEARAIEEAV